MGQKFNRLLISIDQYPSQPFGRQIRVASRFLQVDNLVYLAPLDDSEDFLGTAQYGDKVCTLRNMSLSLVSFALRAKHKNGSDFLKENFKS